MTTTEIAKVLIVDDHPTIREGLAGRIGIEPDLAVCGEAADIPDALRLIDQTIPDVAVVDISLKTGSGLDLIKRIRARDESIRILVWSMHEEDLYADRALRAGAMGYITKDASTDTIISAIRQVLGGKVYLSEEASAHLLNRLITGKEGISDSPSECLSDRELEVFGHIGRGLTTQQVAKKMYLSPATIETYRSRIKSKLEIKTSTELVRKAAQWILETE